MELLISEQKGVVIAEVGDGGGSSGGGGCSGGGGDVVITYLSIFVLWGCHC